MAAKKPIFLFVPGAWHPTTYFEPLAASLENSGYESQAVTNPSLDSSATHETIEGDVENLAKTLQKLTKEEGREVIVVAHSYGGIVTTEAVGRLVGIEKQTVEGHNTAGEDGVAERRATGKILRIVYVAAFVPMEGQSLNSTTVGFMEPHPGPPAFIDAQPPYLLVKPELGINTFYGDLPSEEGERYLAMLGKQPIMPFDSPVQHAGWRTVPSTYVYARLDEAVPLAAQEFMTKRAKEAAVDGQSVQAFADNGIGEFYLDSSHSPMLSKVEELTNILSKIVGN